MASVASPRRTADQGTSDEGQKQHTTTRAAEPVQLIEQRPHRKPPLLGAPPVLPPPPPPKPQLVGPASELTARAMLAISRRLDGDPLDRLHTGLMDLKRFRQGEGVARQEWAERWVRFRIKEANKPRVTLRREVVNALKKFSASVEPPSGSREAEFIRKVNGELEAISVAIERAKTSARAIDWVQHSFAEVFHAIKADLRYQDLVRVVLASDSEWRPAPCPQVVASYTADPKSLEQDLRHWMRSRRKQRPDFKPKAK